MTARKFTDSQEACITELYKSGLSGIELCKKFECSKPTIYRTLRKYGVDIRDNRKYNFNQEYFSCIDSEKKSYWLGFIMADGHVSVRKTGNTLALTSIDYDHLGKFKKDIDHAGSIRPHNRKNCYRFEAHSNCMVEDLIKLGIVPRKSFCASFPPIDKKLANHFIRGVVDGDGGIGFYGNSWRISMSSATKSFIDKLKNIINVDFGVTGGSIDRNEKTFTLSFGGNVQAYNLGNILYRSSSVYLDRKYKKFMEMCRYINNPTKCMIIKVFRYCSVPNCGRILYAKDMCRFHYDQNRYYRGLENANRCNS